MVVDEFQAMFYDCQFPTLARLECGQILGAFSTVVYLSATPFLESYLDMTRQFKDMTFYELLWPESMMQIPKVEVIKSKKSVFKLCSELL